MSKPPLADRTKKELIELARKRGVAGADGLSKEALVKALTAAVKESKAAKAKVVNKAKPAPKAAVKPAAVKPAPSAAPRPAPPAASAPKAAAKTMTTSRVEAVIPADKDLSTKPSNKPGAPPVKDRLTLTAPDPYWLHAFWELTTQSVHRAEAALGSDWHGARPIIRLYDVTSGDTTSTSENTLRDIVVHGGANRWYIDVPQPPRSYQTAIGYLTRTGRFFPLTRSNVVVPPKAGAAESMEDGTDDDRGDRVTADGLPVAREVPTDRDRRPLKDSPFGSGAVPPTKLKKFHFEIDAELIVYVKSDPAATVTLQNEPVKLGPNGTATMRFSLPDSRQIIPAVATSADGMEEQTIVLAVERNTKRLDPMMHDLYGEQ